MTRSSIVQLEQATTMKLHGGGGTSARSVETDSERILGVVVVGW